LTRFYLLCTSAWLLCKCALRQNTFTMERCKRAAWHCKFTIRLWTLSKWHCKSAMWHCRCAKNAV